MERVELMHISKFGIHKSGFTLIELMFSIVILGVFMTTAILFMNRMSEAARVETAKGHLQQKMHVLVDRITNEIRETRWRWMYVYPINPTSSDKNSFLIYCTGRDKDGNFQFNSASSGTVDGGVNWQGICLIAAVADETATTPQTYTLRKYTDYRFNLTDGYLPVTPDTSGYIGDTDFPSEHPDVEVDTTSSTTQFILKQTDGTVIVRFNRDGTPTGGANGIPSAYQTSSNFKSEILMKNITLFMINSTDTTGESPTFPSTKTTRYAFPFRLDVEAYYAKENVKVKMYTQALALNKNT